MEYLFRKFIPCNKKGLRKLPDNKGINNPAAKLNGEKVKEIRSLYKTRKYTQDELANIFKVSRSSIGNIVTYKTWNTKEQAVEIVEELR